MLRWQNTDDGRFGANQPEPIVLPWDPAPEGTLAGDAMPVDELLEFLGWDMPENTFFDVAEVS